MSGSWVETQVPCMIYCGPDICNCSARDYYEILEEYEDEDEDYWEEGKSLTADKRAQQQNRAYEKYLIKLQGYALSGPQEVVAVSSKATCTYPEPKIVSVSKLSTTLNLP